MSLKQLVRSPEEISELAKECLEHEQGGSNQFAHLSFEMGIRTALLWLFFEKERYPLDSTRSPAHKAPVVEDGRDYLDGYEA